MELGGLDALGCEIDVQCGCLGIDKGEGLQMFKQKQKNLLLEAVGKGLGRGRSVNENWVAQGTQKWREVDIYI